MSGIRDAIKIIDKTPEEIEQIKTDVKKAGLPEETITVVIYGLNLILWLPKLLLEQKITIARLKELLFGKGQRKLQQKSKDKQTKGDKNDVDVDPEPDVPTAVNDDFSGNSTVPQALDLASDEGTADGRNGRNPHTVYKSAIEHHVNVSRSNSALKIN